MWQLFTSDTEVLLHGGFIYLPLRFDPAIQAELTEAAGPELPPPAAAGPELAPTLLSAAGGYFVKSLCLQSLVDHYGVVFPEECDQERLRLRRLVSLQAAEWEPVLPPRLQDIIFHILPHFLHNRPGWRRRRGSSDAVLASLAAQYGDAATRSPALARLQERSQTLQRVLQQLEILHQPPPPPQGYHRCGQELRGWFRQALQASLVAQEISRWQEALAQVQALLNLPPAHLAALLAVAAQNSLEINGCGCLPDQKYPGEYLVYLHTGAYALQDYFGRLYLFPDCRVAVPTAGPFQPLVLEQYKHPLLRRFSSRQQICLSHHQADPQFSPAVVIEALEQGVAALYYGYNSRKRNGYNSLDRFGRHRSLVDFEDLRIPADDPRITSGAVEVKNRSL